MDHRTIVDEFHEVVKPVQEWLKRNYNPHAMVIIETHFAKLMGEEMGTPFKYEKD